MANNGNMNPGAFQFIPGQGFVPSAPAQPQGAPGQQGAPGYNPYAQQQGGYAGGYGGFQGQQQYGQQGGYGGYQGQGYPQGGYQQGGYQQGGYQHGGYPQGGYQARSSGYDGQQTFQPRQAQQFSGSSTSEQKPAGPAKTVSLSIGGGSAPVPKSNEPRKVISLGAKKPAETTSASKPVTPAKSMSISIGGKKVATDAATSSTPSTRTSTSAPAAKKEETKKEAQTEAAADWEEPEPAAPVALAAEVEKPASTESKVKVSSGTANFSRASAKTDTDAIAKEAATAADEETLKELYGGDTVDPNIKQHLNIVFIGHVDAGKSTMGGQLLYLCGMVDKRTMEKLEKEAKEAGRESWYLSWALDSTPQERAKGKTVEVGRAYFETDLRRYTILDAPGHKTYVPSMISGAAQADVAVLVISARKGEFETGFERGGQTREHAMLVKNNGINKLIVVVNKMDDSTVQWAQERFDEVQSKITPYLKQVGFNPKTDLTFIPVSAYAGQNIKDRVDKKIAPWYSGPSLLEYLDNFPITDRKVNAPFMLPVSEKYNEMGAMVVGKAETGHVKKGDSLLLMPNKANVEVSGVYDEQGEELSVAYCGDNVRIRLKGITDEEVSPGFVLTSAVKPIRVANSFEAQLAIVDTKNIIAAGYSCVLHLHTLAEEVTITALPHYFDKKTGRKSRKPAQFAKKGMRVIAVIQTSAPICIEKYADYPMLGRFTLRDEGKTVAIGKVTKVLDNQSNETPNIGDLSLNEKDAAATAA
ncbi:hypothetical protein NliqN6_2609 [Naganishia liquefaciens]|uniref:Eukaryotic peptide chain release factor GTP-binding subunit n=1 Tax=Naganishia liquefaciens TaxID=104408 RepID=A0A8H3TS46_9TREE|nr:hypothetical protein NliqN6_2609 [Naganishia liquefaciens]